jgi:hypothetical protein
VKEKRIEGPGFGILGGKGFHIIFDNGYTASVQFGPGNYCDNYDKDHDEPRKHRFWESSTAEIAAIKPGGGLLELDGDSVDARKTPAEVLVFINWVAGGCEGDYPLKEVKDA